MIMANLCDTQYKITSEKKAVADLWNTLQEMNVNEKNIWLGDLANHYGIDYKAKGFSVRGEIYWAEYEEYSDYALLSFDTETAWAACNDFFDALNCSVHRTSLLRMATSLQVLSLYCSHCCR